MDGLGILIVEFNGLKDEYYFNNEMVSNVNKKMVLIRKIICLRVFHFHKCGVSIRQFIYIYYPNWGGGVTSTEKGLQFSF